MRLGFTGTQNGMTRIQAIAVFDEIDTLWPDEVDHGICVGADEEFHGLVRSLSPIAEIVGHPPTNTSKMAKCVCDRLWLPKPYLERNRDIVDASDRLLAAPQGPEEQRSGTWSTVRYARKRGKPITIVWPDGSITRENTPASQPAEPLSVQPVLLCSEEMMMEGDDGWHDMDTVPKDGCFVLLCNVHHGNVTVAAWASAERIREDYEWWDDLGGGGWVNVQGGDPTPISSFYNALYFQAWRPLPAPRRKPPPTCPPSQHTHPARSE